MVVKKNSRLFGFEATFFTSLCSELLLSGRPGFDSRPGQTLRAYIFARLWPTGLKIINLERSHLHLLV